MKGQPIQVLYPGMPNPNAGPDFLNARILLNGIEWNGHVEIHVKSSDWQKHGHQNDPAYNNVVLHVVYECDCEVFTQNGIQLVQAELKNVVDKKDIENALAFIESDADIPCAGSIRYVNPIIIRQQKERALFNRLESRYNMIKLQLEDTRNDWETVTYMALARAFGTNINKHAFERLAQIVTLGLLQRNASALKAEAILFYASGLLELYDTPYASELRRLSKPAVLKHDIEPMVTYAWKFSALRPYNFPTVRMAQFADLMHRQKNLFSKLVECTTLREFEALLACKASAFWDNHFNFKKASPVIGVKKASKAFIHTVIINAVIPVYFAYAKHIQDADMTERCIAILESMPGETNHITKEFKAYGITSKTAFDSQALIELKNNFCIHKKCLTCSIGLKLINKV